MKKIHSTFLFLAGACLAVTTSCINEAYDLNKEIDLEMTLMPGKTIPIGNIKPITLKDLIGQQETASVLQEDVEGNLHIYYAGEKIQQKISAPDMTFTDVISAGTSRIQLGTFVVPNIPAGLPEQILPSIEGLQIPTDKTTYEFKAEKTDLPLELTDLKSAEVSTTLTLSFSFESLPVKNIYLRHGSKIVIPDFILLGQLPAGWHKSSVSNDLVLDEDKAVGSAGGLDIVIPVKGIDFTKKGANQGLVKPGHFLIDDKIFLDCKVFIKSTDVITGGTVSPVINISVQAGDIHFDSVEAKFKPDISMDVPPIKLEGLPDFLNSKTVIDLKGLRFNLNVSNSFPFGAEFGADILPVIGGEPGNKVTVGPLVVNSSTGEQAEKTAYSLSEAGTGAPDGFTDVKVEGLDGLVSQIPEEVRVENTRMDVQDKFGKVTLGRDYGFEMDYNVYAPLQFGEKLNFEIVQDMALNLDLSESGVCNAIIKVNAENTLPVNFKVIPAALDPQGSLDPDLNIECASTLKAGSLKSSTVNPIEIKISSKKPLVLNNLRLHLKASGSSEISEILNVNQYLRLTDLRLTLPDGVTYDPEIMNGTSNPNDNTNPNPEEGTK